MARLKKPTGSDNRVAWQRTFLGPLNVFKVDWRVPYFSRQSPVLGGSRRHRQGRVSCHAKVLPGLSFDTKVNYLKNILLLGCNPKLKEWTKGKECSILKHLKFSIRFGGVRGILIILGLGVTGLWLFLVSGHLGELRPGMVGFRSCSRLAKPAPVAPNAVAEDKVGRQGSPAFMASAGMEPKNPGLTTPEMVKEGTGQSSRLPAQITNLVKRQNLEIVIEKYARRYGVDQELVWAVIRQESGFNSRAVSPKGAMGLMQLMPGTAAMLGVSDAFDVEQNIAGGIKYLEQCLNRFNQNVPLALAAYNAGPDNVVKYQGCPPFPETRQYVASILKAYGGEPIRGDLKPIGLIPVMDQEVPDPVRPRGLAWKVSGPKWRIAAPQCQIGSPRWKATLLPF